MFFTFLSVCTTSDLLKIPLTLDVTRTINIPSGVTTIDVPFKIDPSQDADFQQYLSKIKDYEVDSITIAPESWSGAAGTTFTGTLNFVDLGFSSTFPTMNLISYTYLPLSLKDANLLSMASDLSKYGKMNVNLNGTFNNNTGGTFNLKVKVHLKIKVV